MATYKNFSGQLGKLQLIVNQPLRREEKNLKLFFDLSSLKKLRLKNNLASQS